jgi:hypothetical protein
MTPAITFKVPAVEGVVTLIVMFVPDHGHVTVVDESPEAEFATHSELDPPELKVTVGLKTAVTQTFDAPEPPT